MFDVGFDELMLIVIVAIVVIGPKDMPKALRMAGQWIGKVRRERGNHFTLGQAETLVDAISLTVGSSSAITACGAARLGLRVGFAGVVGDDDLGRFMLAALADRGIDVDACLVDPSRTTGASVILGRGGDRAILTAVGAITETLELQTMLDLMGELNRVRVLDAFSGLDLAKEGGACVRCREFFLDRTCAVIVVCHAQCYAALSKRKIFHAVDDGFCFSHWEWWQAVLQHFQFEGALYPNDIGACGEELTELDVAWA